MLRFDQLLDYMQGDPINNAEVLCLVENKSFTIFTGKNEYNDFHIQINKALLKHWHYAVCDFISYTKALNKVPVIISTDEDLKLALTKMKACEATRTTLRPYEPEILIHSTTLDSWHNIQADGCLYAWATLKRLGKIQEVSPIGALLGDPADYSEYIMLGSGQSLAGEYVVMSKQAGFIKCCDNEVYEPGVRLYLDAKALAEQGKLIRDGIHYKVRDCIELKDYLIDYVDCKKLEAFDMARTYTPKSFSTLCNRYFESTRLRMEPLTEKTL